MSVANVSKAALKRLPLYLGYLQSLGDSPSGNISATTIASALSLGEVQVRKDLALVCDGGKPKVGYETKTLIKALECFLGYNRVNDAIIVGAGHLGQALLNYDGFQNNGLNVLAAFDIDETVCQKEIGHKPILPIAKLPDLCRRMNIRLGIITVPAQSAQSVCDLMVESGILAILNFSPVHLLVPDNILVQNENMAVPLALLSHHLSTQLGEGVQ